MEQPLVTSHTSSNIQGIIRAHTEARLPLPFCLLFFNRYLYKQKGLSVLLAGFNKVHIGPSQKHAGI
jgi:hypothetical protein